MTNIELYINGRLCDTDDEFSPRLSRQLLTPAELNTKDAQMSFTIAIPTTGNNNEIFRYAHVEETKNKFNVEYRAELAINSIRVLVGEFRMSEITVKQYKGNLYVPQPKEIKDIFGDQKLNQNLAYNLPFTDFVSSVNAYNNAAITTPQIAIFPAVLYGLLPKIPSTPDGDTYTSRSIWDGTVRVGLEDFPPSINPLLMLKHIFSSNGYTLTGSAFDNERLTKLYMSYKNATDYQQPWNYGYHAKMRLTGLWNSQINARTGANELERGVNVGSDATGTVYSTDLLSCNNTKITVLEDTGGNIVYGERVDDNGRTWVNGRIRIPASGLYKVVFNSSMIVSSATNFRQTDSVTEIQHIGGQTANANNKFDNNIYEVRLCRDRGNLEFNLTEPKINGTFQLNNQPQSSILNAFLKDFLGNEIEDPDEGKPRYYPDVTLLNGQINFIDKYQDKNHLLGFCFGANRDYSDINSAAYINPRDGVINSLAQVQAAKPGVSWEKSENDGDNNRLAINAPGYWMFGRLSNFDNPGDNPNININYSGGPFVYDKELDVRGNPVGSVPGNIILDRFMIERYYTYVFNSGNPAHNGYAYVHIGAITIPFAIIQIVGGVGVLDTTFPTSTVPVLDLRLTLYLKTASFDVSSSLVITRTISATTQDAIGWTKTDKYKIQLDNAPDVYARRGQYKGAGGYDSDWWAQGQGAAVVWLEAGEILTVGAISSEGRYRENGMHSSFGMVGQDVYFDLSIQPFRTDEGWLRVSEGGTGIAPMSWTDTGNFVTDYIDLVKFLNADMRTDEFIDNFCKAFNLKLTPISDTAFSLDVKQTETAVTGQYVNLDEVATIKERTNTSLELPATYRLGFTVDKDEYGFYVSNDDGGGSFSTGSIDDTVIEQKSSFSYNWFYGLNKQVGGGFIGIDIPVITKKEAWNLATPYAEAMLKRYTDQPYRVWYFDGLLTAGGATFPMPGGNLQPARVSNVITNVSILNYKNQAFTILYNFFTLLIDSSSHYTIIEAYLTAVQYQAFNGSKLAMLNGDLYYVAELSGYDPKGRNKTTIKLIRKIK